MPATHVKFHSSNGKRAILIVDNDRENQEYLWNILEQNYEVLIAESGEEGLDIIHRHREPLSLVLLGLKLPGIRGFDVIQHLKHDPDHATLPVIVVTAYRDAEVQSLTLGAMDFISKPFPKPEIVLARVLRAIELSEDRDIIQWTERDQLTGLYNRDYFYRYAAQFDAYHIDKPMDAVVIDINRFHMVNERYGKAYGDQILRQIGEKLKALVADSGGIVCRRGGDTFLMYCPHRDDYETLIHKAACCLKDNNTGDSRVRLRMGVYTNVDKTIEIERRFDRAKMAADSVRANYSRAIGFFDDELHRKEVFTEQLLEDFHTAIAEHQFMIYYQPKFDIQEQDPVLSSAEALVRWKHPTLGMICPDQFIPLFERNGLIQKLDYYVWRQVAAQLRDWKDRLGFSMPVSINISRVDMYDPTLQDKLLGLLEEYALRPEDIYLEITESAYTEGAGQIIETARELREKGFLIEMDDFGAGYSSLNMVAALPVDALKLDIAFLRNAFSKRKDTRMLDVVIDLADALGVPTIAEGVETAEQVFTLKNMGCRFVQGYYFSKPIPAEEYEDFLEKRKSQKSGAPIAGGTLDSPEYTLHKTNGQFTYAALHDPLTGLYNKTAFEMFLVDTVESNAVLLLMEISDFRTLTRNSPPKIAEGMIKKVAAVLKKGFRSVDYLCHIEDDIFVVIMSRVNSSMRQLVFDKIELVNALLQESDGLPQDELPEDELPPVRVCAGAAFSDRENPKGDILHDAYTALERVKEIRRYDCNVF